jgi:hypothetical protein
MYPDASFIAVVVVVVIVFIINHHDQSLMINIVHIEYLVFTQRSSYS